MHAATLGGEQERESRVLTITMLGLASTLGRSMHTVLLRSGIAQCREALEARACRRGHPQTACSSRPLRNGGPHARKTTAVTRTSTSSWTQAAHIMQSFEGERLNKAGPRDRAAVEKPCQRSAMKRHSVVHAGAQAEPRFTSR